VINNTHYNTDDLMYNLDLMLEALNDRHQATFEISSVRYAKCGEVEDGLLHLDREINRKHHLKYSYRGASSWFIPLRLRPKSEFYGALSDMEKLAIASLEQPVVPVSLVEKIWEWMAKDYSRAWYPTGSKALYPDLEFKPIRIMSKRDQQYKPSTPEERAQRIAGWYGTGGQLEGPSWGWRSGHRSATGEWYDPLEKSRKAYEREREHREVHRATLCSMGVEVKPYETFPEWLRRRADELERQKREWEERKKQREAAAHD
jgi:hypothetical protein